MHQIMYVDFKGIKSWFKVIKYEETAFKGDTWRWMMTETQFLRFS